MSKKHFVKRYILIINRLRRRPCSFEQLAEYLKTENTAVANNESAKELMDKDRPRELAVVLTQTIKQTASIDWTIKESVRAKLKVAVKRILRKYGYPPDMQLLATETVLKQAEMIATEMQQ